MVISAKKKNLVRESIYKRLKREKGVVTLGRESRTFACSRGLCYIDLAQVEVKGRRYKMLKCF